MRRLWPVFCLLPFFSLGLASPEETEFDPGPLEVGQGAGSDLFGDPLPPGALARFGTVRFRFGKDGDASALSPDGTILAQATRKGEISIMELAAGKVTRRFQADPEPPVELAFSPAGDVLAFLRADGSIHLWDPGTGKAIRLLERPACKTIGGVGFFADGKYVLAGTDSEEGKAEIYVWQTADGRRFGPIRPVPRVIVGGDGSPDGKTLVTSGWDWYGGLGDSPANRLLQMWDLGTGKELWRREAEGRYLRVVSFSVGGKTVTSLTDKKIQVWNAADGKQLLCRDIPDNPGAPFRLTPDGKALIQWDTAGRSSIRDLETGKRLGGYKTPSPFFSLTFSSDGRILAHGISGRRVWLWEAGSLDSFAPPETTVFGVRVPLWKPDSAGKMLTPRYGADAVGLVRFAPDGRTLLTDGDRVIVWDSATGRELRVFEHRGEGEWNYYRPGGGVVTFNPYHVYPTLSPLIGVDRATGDRLLSLPVVHDQMVYAAASPDGKVLASWGSHTSKRWEEAPEDRTVQLWDLATGQELHRLEGDYPSAAAFSPDGKFLAMQTRPEIEELKPPDDHGRRRKKRVLVIAVWDVTTGGRVDDKSLLQGDNIQGVESLAVSPDGKRLAIVWWHGSKLEIALCDARKGKITMSLPAGGLDPCSAPVFSPDGATVACGLGSRFAEEHVIALWAVASGKLRGRLTGHTDAVTSLAFSPDGATLASGSPDATALLWDLKGRMKDEPEWKPALSPEELRDLWSDLAGADAATVQRAIRRLTAAPADAVPFLAKELKPTPGPDAALLAKRIAALDAEAFDEREQATRDLAAVGRAAVPALQQALDGAPSPEAEARLKRLLAQLDKPAALDLSPGLLRSLRAVQVLEGMTAQEARRHLEALAAGNADDPVTEAARAALRRVAPPRPAAP